MDKFLNQRTVIAILVLFALVFPLIYADNAYILHVMTVGFIFTISVYGMNIIAGFTGQLSLAHAGFFAIGAYTLGLLTTRTGMNFWLALVAAVLLTSLAGLVLGAIALRTKEHFFAIYTLIVGYLIYLLIDVWDGLTGGVRGLIGIPIPDPIGPIAFDSPTAMYYLVLFFLLLSIVIAVRIVRSLTGRTYVAIRNSEELAQTLGINTGVNKLVSFVVSVAYAGLAGALYAALTRFIGPEVASTTMVFNFLMYLIVGGIGTLSGPIVGTMLFIWFEQFLKGFQEYQMLIFGPVLVLVVIFYPRGIVGGFYQLKAKLQGRRDKRAPQQFQPMKAKEAEK
ncbi:branched-chain amino acid ABC transporter permease [Planococcus lenghuensis]|uniref:Branched-chain amino acid ABC transporter permease n=1 Tax=Planococcus lenghuensis TaxID=2213202 RepID=A0A1Q2L0T5_9BACL|nr:branched-chain amino acid ABC transporter permease [Planococcus lenghuensis]AQQ54070.1 branched-chain amino acid ABC transporter permease [Planococcus lenghuensis]